jgi:uncharacterized protein YndB with AHSA1/START domain
MSTGGFAAGPRTSSAADADLIVTHVIRSPRARVYRAFTDPDEFAAWWGPIGNALPREQVEVDLRAGGFICWHEIFPGDPDTWTDGYIDLKEVVDGRILDGVMRITGNLPGEHAPFTARMRIELHDEVDGKTRLEVRQWLPETHVAGTRHGWSEAFRKLDAVLATAP